ncbi:MAG: FAD-dependent oxidoreductase, partial [Verrucomicrobiota bacterium]
IVGQGLAGTVFAWKAIEREKSVVVLDLEEEVTSSKVAAGIVNRYTGPRLTESWRFDELWPAARSFYQNCERDFLRETFWRESPIVRLFVDEEQAARCPDDQSGQIRIPGFDCALGGFEAPGAQLDVEGFLRKSRELFQSAGQFQNAEKTSLAEFPARFTGYCQGYRAMQVPPFDWVPLRAGKGEILDLEIPDLVEHRMIHLDKWVLPLRGSKFRAGSTYAWDDLTNDPTETGRAEIEAGLCQLLVKPNYHITRARAAIRPMGFRGWPRMGRHPQLPNAAYFNGLGSKGVLLAPFFAQQMLEHLETGSPIDEDVRIEPYWKS